MKILITGALGHIGSHIITKIHKNKNIKKIFLVDNFLSKKFNILFKIKNRKYKFIYGDLTEEQFTMNLPKVDYVLHLASITDVEKSFNEPKEILKNNLGCFKNIVKYCLNNNSKLIHISSTSIYGSPKKNINENSKPNPQSPYAQIKVKEENILKKTKKLNFITLRFGTISGYSDGMNFHTVVNKFCLYAIMKITIPIWGKAMKLYRPYLSLNDAYKVIDFTLKKRVCTNDFYNVLSENKTVQDILNILKNNNLKIKVKYINSKLYNQFSFITEKTKIEQLGLKLNSKISQDIEIIMKKLIIK
tara:strand:+ start:331 stop:1239 length:909 start_codon:yes stop_codon:yes gene_type:complete